MASTLTWVLIDCHEPEKVAGFWGEVLGWPIKQNDHGTWWGSKNGGLG